MRLVNPVSSTEFDQIRKSISAEVPSKIANDSTYIGSTLTRGTESFIKESGRVILARD